MYFWGWHEPLLSALLKLDIYVQSSVTEGFGMAIAEAMICGLTVVATSVGGIPEIVINEETGLLVRSNDSKAMAKHIEYLIMNPSIRRKMGVNGRIRAENMFTIGRMVNETTYLYRILAKH